MKLICTSVERHPYTQVEPKIERIRLRPVVPGPVTEIVLCGCDSAEFPGLKEGQEIELSARYASAAENQAELPTDLEPEKPSFWQRLMGS